MAGPTTLTATGRLAREASPVPFLYRVLRGPLRQALTRWFDLRVDGLEHLPSSGPYLIAANHHNYLDGVVLGVTVPEPISFLVMPRVWRATPLHPVFHRNIRSIPICSSNASATCTIYKRTSSSSAARASSTNRASSSAPSRRPPTRPATSR